MKEIIFNFWYLTDESGLVYSLKAKPYVYEGTDADKCAFLKERAKYDFEVARDYQLPSNFKVVYPQGDINAIPLSAMQQPQTLPFILEPIYKSVEKEIELFATLKVADNPYYVLTALYLDVKGKVELYKI